MAGATAAIRIIENAMLKGRGSRTKGNSFIVWGSNYLWPEGLRLACIQRSSAALEPVEEIYHRRSPPGKGWGDEPSDNVPTQNAESRKGRFAAHV